MIKQTYIRIEKYSGQLVKIHKISYENNENFPIWIEESNGVLTKTSFRELEDN